MYLVVLSLASWTVVCSAAFSDFDYFVFSQQWPEAACIGANLSHQHTCKIDHNVTTWSVHGLWPTKKNSSPPGPNYCNKSWNFNLPALYPIWSNMMKYWTNLYKEESVDSLWEHEWTKHGTCAAKLPYLDSELLYFNTTLQLNRRYDMLQILASKGITPSDTKTYHFADVSAALGGVVLQCYYDPARKTQYLVQIEMCISLDSFNQFPCPKASKRVERDVRDLDGMSSKSGGVVAMYQGEEVRSSHANLITESKENDQLVYSARLENCFDTEEIAYPARHN